MIALALTVLFCWAQVGRAAANHLSEKSALDFSDVKPSLTIVPDEATHTFDVAGASTTFPEGALQFVVSVPKTATGQHGIGIDGGVYKNVKGVPVKPGIQTAITAIFKPGSYTIFDSYKNNRELGYSLPITVYPSDTFGTSCKIVGNDALSAVADTLRKKGTDCRTANRVASKMFSFLTQETVPQLMPVPAGKFSCTYGSITVGPDAVAGTKVVCKRPKTKKRPAARVDLTFRR